ncbi:MAG: uridine kinase family protein [Burkholderiales bacterium]
MSYLVAVCGPIGSGKTSIVRGLVGQLGDATAIHMDSYEQMTSAPVREVLQWAERGADFESLEVPLLAEHLQRLKRGEAVVEPAGRTTITPRKYLVFETQFGRAHRATGAQIDLLIWIDVALDVALARKLKLFAGEALRDERADAARERLAWLDGYLGNYLQLVSPLMQVQAARVRPQADLVIDGSGALDASVRRAAREILTRLP